MPIQADHHILTSTTSFTSLNSHLGIEQSCCDDLESPAYIFIYFLCGSLPWYNAKAATHNQHNKIKQMKVDSNPSLVAGLPNEFNVFFLDYPHALSFESKPADYAYMHHLFHDLCICKEHEDDDIFDWCLPTMNQDDETLSNHMRVNGKTRKYDTGTVDYSDRVLVLFKNLQYIYICLIMTWTGYVLILIINIHKGLPSCDGSFSCTGQSCTIHRFTVVMIFFEYGSFPAWYFPYYDTWHSKDMVILHIWLVGYVSLHYGTLVAYVLLFFPHNYGYSWFQTVAITKAIVTVTATIGYDSQNKQTSQSSVTSLRLTKPWQHYVASAAGTATAPAPSIVAPIVPLLFTSLLLSCVSLGLTSGSYGSALLLVWQYLL